MSGANKRRLVKFRKCPLCGERAQMFPDGKTLRTHHMSRRAGVICDASLRFYADVKAEGEE